MHIKLWRYLQMALQVRCRWRFDELRTNLHLNINAKYHHICNNVPYAGVERPFMISNKMNLDFDPKNVTNLDLLRENQLKKFNNLREVARNLRFIPIDPSGSYISTSFKSFDGGRFNLDFDPFEFDIIRVADSHGNVKINFAAPTGDLHKSDDLHTILQDIDTDPIIQNFLSILKVNSLRDVTEILTARETLMEIAEFACMFESVTRLSQENKGKKSGVYHIDKTIILRDGLLRTKKIKSELVTVLRQLLAENSDYVKVAGVAKTSKIIFLLKAALICEQVFPKGQIGYVKIPLEIENMAYRWSGGRRLGPNTPATPLEYAFGALYVVKLSRQKDLLVTVEIPTDPMNNTPIYSDDDITEMMGHMARDAAHSYPILGYPQTLMRAHEYAASLGIPISILRDRIMSELFDNTDAKLADYVRDFTMLTETINKGTLGGRA